MSEASKNPFEPFFDEIRLIVREEIAAVRAKDGAAGLLTADELANRLKVPLSWVYEQSRQGGIPTYRLGRYIRFDLREVLTSQKKD